MPCPEAIWLLWSSCIVPPLIWTLPEIAGLPVEFSSSLPACTEVKPV